MLYPLSLVAGDFNGDGMGDLAFDNPNTNQISVLLGNSAGTAQSVLTYPATGDIGLVAGDFAGNGRLDLALVSPNSTTILLNNGDGTFTSASQLAITPQATPLVADVNGDGTDDVLVVNGSGEILYRQGVPGQPGTFEPPVIINPPLPDGSNPYASRDIAWLPQHRSRSRPRQCRYPGQRDHLLRLPRRRFRPPERIAHTPASSRRRSSRPT